MIGGWHGIERAYVRDDGAMAGSLRALIRLPLQLDRHGVRAAWGEHEDPLATVVVGIRHQTRERSSHDGCVAADASPRRPGGRQARDPVGMTSPLSPREERAWHDARKSSDAVIESSAEPSRPWQLVFEDSVAAIARSARAPVLALGGGVDAAAVLVAWRARGIAMPWVVTLATGLPAYDEVEAALAIARAMGVRCDVLDISPERLVALAPEAAIAAETPLYNLHPVHRLALAREVQRRGAASLVTGDGADAVFAGRPDLDYVPIVAALTRAARLELRSAFFADAVIAGTGFDREKRVLRDYLRANRLSWLADRAKRPRLVPPCDLSQVLDRDRVEHLARRLDIAPRLDIDRARVCWLTLDHLVRHLERP